MIRRRLFSLAVILLLVPVLFVGVSAASVSDPAPVVVSFPAPTFDPVESFYLSAVQFDLSFLGQFAFMVGNVPCINVLYRSDVITWHIDESMTLELPSGIFLVAVEGGLVLYSMSNFAPSVVTFGGRDSFSTDSSLLSDLSDTAGAFLSTVGQIVDSIVSSPLLLVTVGIFFLGGCVALFARFLGKE